MRNCIIASTSTLHGGSYLEYILPELQHHFKNCSSLLFIPFAQPGGISYQDYTEKVSQAFAKIKIAVRGLHEFENPKDAIRTATGIFTGGGNTFLLLSTLYRLDCMNVLSDAIKKGIPYLGTSAGSNICGLSIQTTNDMPIVYPPSFQALGILPFNLNPHYLDPNPTSTHMGETREMRINEFHHFNSAPVLGLREGSWLEVKGSTIVLKGDLNARLFRQNQNPEELITGVDLSDLK